MDYTRGSEWRRWDLHIHTPDTLKNDCYTVSATSGEDKWEKFFTSILNYVGDMSDPQKAVCAIGITDYFSVENYKKVISNEELTHKIPLILPNIELRLLPVSKQELNLHCIFNPTLSTDEIEERFLSKLTLQKDGQEYTALPNSLIRLGKAIDSTITDDFIAKKTAVEQFSITIDQLRKIFDNDKSLRRDTLIIVPNSQNNGASGIGNESLNNSASGLTTWRQELYKFTDAIFSSNPTDIMFFVGKGSVAAEKIKKKHGKLMPCLHGSDAHQYNKIFEPDSKRYCWIKADCTFSGLKQIIYEPETRVKICEQKPEEKKPYFVIDQVVISDENFTNLPILFNENLTCIIGGKSTGKSVLLNNIASTIDSKQVNDKFSIINGGKPQASLYPTPKMTVKWRDGAETLKANNQNDRKIVYIPQTYLNRLADETTEKTDIDDIIEDVLLQNPTIKSAYLLMDKKIAETKSYIDKKIYDIIANRKKVKEIKNKIIELGVLKSIEDEIKKLKQKKKELSQQSSATEEELQSYDKALIDNREIEKKSSELLYYKDFLDNTISILQKIEIDPFINEDFAKNILAEIDCQFIAAQSAWEKFKSLQYKYIEETQNNLHTQELENKKIIDLVQQKMSDTEIVSKISKDIDEEEKKKTEIEDYYKQIDVLEKQYKIDSEDLIYKSSSFETIYDEYALVINTETGLSSAEDGTLKFNAASVFRGDYFVGEFIKTFDKTKKKFKELIKIEDNPCSYNDYDDSLKKGMIEASFIEGSTSILRKATTIENALRTIFSDFFTINYTVSVDNDTIKEMSPGKKALVLLKLLINLAESNCPILIDQPEDDLDNRSIYHDLASFIREKKTVRQIILVTHNANIVLGCDAEEVIVANQKGANSPNNQYRFEYRSGSIENTEARKDNNGKIIYGILNSKGMQQHICEILEGGKDAFDTRKKKYSFNE